MGRVDTALPVCEVLLSTECHVSRYWVIFHETMQQEREPCVYVCVFARPAARFKSIWVVICHEGLNCVHFLRFYISDGHWKSPGKRTASSSLSTTCWPASLSRCCTRAFESQFVSLRVALQETTRLPTYATISAIIVIKAYTCWVRVRQ